MARHGKAAHNRKNSIKRQPDGRPTQNKEARATYDKALRVESEAMVIETAIAPRLRAGIRKEHARSIGTLEAYLFSIDALSRDQYDAACWYQEMRVKVYSATDNPNSPREPRPAGSGDQDAYERFCSATLEKWQNIRSGVQDMQNQVGMTSNLWAALDNLERGSMPDHMLGDLRIALNAVHKVRVGDRKSAA